MPDDVVTQLRPVLGWKQCPDSDLDLVRFGLSGPSKTSHQTVEVGIYGDPGNTEGVAEYHIRGLPADAGQRHQILHALGHLTIKPLGEGRPKLDQSVSLRPKEPGRLDELFEFRAVCSGVRGGVRIALKDDRRHQVDSLISALRGQNCCHQQLQRVAEIELSVGIGIGGRQDAVHSAGTAYQRSTRFVERHDRSLVSDLGSQLGVGHLGAPPDLLELMPSQ
jgi:hypothetical protein